ASHGARTDAVTLYRETNMEAREDPLARLARKQRQSGSKQKAGPSAPQLVLPPPSAPMAVARSFVEARCLHEGKAEELTLRYWCGCWWAWRTTHWVEADQPTLRPTLCH